MLALQWCDITFNYIPGKNVVVPDTLHLNDCKTKMSTEDMEAYVQLAGKRTFGILATSF